MTQSQEVTHLVVQISGGVDDEALDIDTRNLYGELGEMDLESVELVKDSQPPPGAKGDPITLGLLAVSVLPAAIQPLIVFLQSWVMRNQGESRKVRIKTPSGMEVEFTPSKQLTPAELAKLAEKLGQVKA